MQPQCQASPIPTDLGYYVDLLNPCGSAASSVEGSPTYTEEQQEDLLVSIGFTLDSLRSGTNAILTQVGFGKGTPIPPPLLFGELLYGS